MGSAPAREFSARELVDALAVHLNAALRGCVQPANQVEQGSLARAGRAHQGDKVPPGNVEVDAMERFNLLAAALVRLRQATDLDQMAHDAPLSASFTAWPSWSDSGGDSTTRSPSRRPLCTCCSPPTVCPNVTLRRSTLPSAYTNTTPMAPSARTDSAGTR